MCSTVSYNFIKLDASITCTNWIKSLDIASYQTHARYAGRKAKNASMVLLGHKGSIEGKLYFYVKAWQGHED